MKVGCGFERFRIQPALMVWKSVFPFWISICVLLLSPSKSDNIFSCIATPPSKLCGISLRKLLGLACMLSFKLSKTDLWRIINLTLFSTEVEEVKGSMYLLSRFDIYRGKLQVWEEWLYLAIHTFTSLFGSKKSCICSVLFTCVGHWNSARIEQLHLSWSQQRINSVWK